MRKSFRTFHNVAAHKRNRTVVIVRTPETSRCPGYNCRPSIDNCPIFPEFSRTSRRRRQRKRRMKSTSSSGEENNGAKETERSTYPSAAGTSALWASLDPTMASFAGHQPLDLKRQLTLTKVSSQEKESFWEGARAPSPRVILQVLPMCWCCLDNESGSRVRGHFSRQRAVVNSFLGNAGVFLFSCDSRVRAALGGFSEGVLVVLCFECTRCFIAVGETLNFLILGDWLCYMSLQFVFLGIF